MGVNTIDDLRATLHQHAADVPVDSAPGRRAEIHRRVANVRRRRRAGAAAALAAVFVSAGALAILPRHPGNPEPAAELAGHQVPKEMDSLGFGYRFERSVEGVGSVEVSIAPAAATRLVSWAATRGRVTVDSSVSGQFSSSTDFSDFTLIPAEMEGTVTVSAPGKVAVAVYTLDSLAPGVRGDGAVFRSQVAGGALIAAEFGTPANPPAVVTPVPAGRMMLATYCADAPAGSWIHVYLNGDESITGGCDGGSLDAAVQTSYTLPVRGSRVRLSAEVTAGEDGERLTSGAGAVGLAVYSAPPLAGRVGSQPIAELVESDGHLWQLESLVRSDRGDRSLSLRPSGPALVVAAASRTKAIAEPFINDRALSVFRGGGVLQLGRSSAGDRVTVRLDRDDPGGLLGLAVYTRVD
jgi:hypothetical protein